MAEPSLAEKKCTPCEKGAPPLKGAPLKILAEQVCEWDLVEDHHLRREFTFDDFQEALEWVNMVGEIAETEGHHPWFHFTYGQVILEVFTHKVDGLVENDFILAAKIDEAWEQR